MEFYQIRNEFNKAFGKAVCSNSPLGRGERKQQAMKLYDEFMSKLEAISKS